MKTDINILRKQIEELVQLFHAVFDNHAEDLLMTAAQVAALVNIDIDKIYALCVDGSIPHRKVGRRYQFKKSDIITWMKKQDADSPFSVDSYVEKYLVVNKLRG